MFIKKSMGEMKKSAAPPPKPASAAPASLGPASMSAGATPAAQKPANGHIDVGYYSSTASMKKAPAGGSSDPFASLAFGSSSIPAQPR